MLPRRALTDAVHDDLLAICKSKSIPFTYPKADKKKLAASRRSDSVDPHHLFPSAPFCFILVGYPKLYNSYA